MSATKPTAPEPTDAWAAHQLDALETIFGELAWGLRHGRIGNTRARTLSARLQKLLPIIKTMAAGAGMDVGFNAYRPTCPEEIKTLKFPRPA
jgi:hypothetical protein